MYQDFGLSHNARHPMTNCFNFTLAFPEYTAVTALFFSQFIFLIFLIFSLTICAFPANKTHEGGMGDSGGPLFLAVNAGENSR